MQVYRFVHDSIVKTGCCNGRASITYCIAENREEAEKEIAEHSRDDAEEDHGNCAVCLAEQLADGDYEIAGSNEKVVESES